MPTRFVCYVIRRVILSRVSVVLGRTTNAVSGVGRCIGWIFSVALLGMVVHWLSVTRIIVRCWALGNHWLLVMGSMRDLTAISTVAAGTAGTTIPLLRGQGSFHVISVGSCRRRIKVDGLVHQGLATLAADDECNDGNDKYESDQATEGKDEA